MEETLKPKALCDVIVVTHNKIEHTQQLVKSFIVNTKTPARMVMVDNGSGDGTREYLSSLTDTDMLTFIVILNNENKGYIKAANQGLRVSDAPYVCFCHNDIIFTRGWLDELVITFKEFPDVGLLNPNSNALAVKPNEGESYDDFSDRLKKTYSKGSFADMPFCYGFCMAVRRHVIDKVGGLNEAYAPMYFEDSDYSRAVYQAGYRLGIARRSYIWRQESVGAAQSPKKDEIYNKSRIIYLRKWGKSLRIAWVIDSYEEALKVLDQAVNVARDANFVWMWVKDLTKDRKDIFKEANVAEFADVKFNAYQKNRAIILDALKTKKKYDLIITREKKLCSFLKIIGQPTSPTFDPALFRELKFKHLDKV